MTAAEARSQIDYRALMKKVEEFVQALDRSDDVSETIHNAAVGIVKEFRGELGILGGRLYRREGNDYVLQATFPEARPIEGIRIPLTYRPIELLLAEGTLYMTPEDAGYDDDLERALGVEDFAAIEVGDEAYLLAFNVVPAAPRDEILISLGILRHTISQKIRRERIQGVFNEARKIQLSILPRRPPEFAGFDIAGRIEPMESVGGDFYDYIPITDKILGLAIADVSGHGLPAALQVRDIYTGLRMGLARDFKIVRTVERLNGIINESTLTSRFVALFYGELEQTGHFIYVNAGHTPPLRVRRDGGVDLLTEGGAVLGPIEDATYERGFLVLEPGEVLVFYTDGIVETIGRPDEDCAEGDCDEELGLERLRKIVHRRIDQPAREIVDAIFDAVAEFSGDAPAQDDRTVVVVKRAQ